MGGEGGGAYSVVACLGSFAHEPRIFQHRAREGGGVRVGGYSIVASLRHLAIDHASLSRRSKKGLGVAYDIGFRHVGM